MCQDILNCLHLTRPLVPQQQEPSLRDGLSPCLSAPTAWFPCALLYARLDWLGDGEIAFERLVHGGGSRFGLCVERQRERGSCGLGENGETFLGVLYFSAHH